MNILIEGTFFKFKYITGIERYLFLVLDLICKCDLFDKIYVVLTHKIPRQYSKRWNNIEYIYIKSNTASEWNEIYNFYEIDIVYSTFEPPAQFPPEPIKLIYVLHDPERYLYPEFIDPESICEHMNNFEEYLSQERFFIITVSNSSKNDIIKVFPNLVKRVYVVYNYLSESLIYLSKKIASTNPIYNNYFLVIGKYRPSKNTLGIVKAFEKRSAFFSNYKLVIVGTDGWYDEFTNYIKQNNPSNVIIKNYVTDEELVHLIKYCYAFISGSIYEGFGIPVIEAYYLGAKRIFLSDIDVYKELNITGAKYFNTFNIDDICNKVFIKKTEPINQNELSFPFRYDNVLQQFKNVIININKE